VAGAQWSGRSAGSFAWVRFQVCSIERLCVAIFPSGGRSPDAANESVLVAMSDPVREFFAGGSHLAQRDLLSLAGDCYPPVAT
jgi:hypothetical protein